MAWCALVRNVMRDIAYLAACQGALSSYHSQKALELQHAVWLHLKSLSVLEQGLSQPRLPVERLRGERQLPTVADCQSAAGAGDNFVAVAAVVAAAVNPSDLGVD